MSFGQSDTPAESAPFPGVDPDEWNSLLARGAISGVLDAEEITHVLRTVELTGDVLEGVQKAVAERNIRIPPKTPTASWPAVVVAAASG